jgi:hypothetical protein
MRPINRQTTDELTPENAPGSVDRLQQEAADSQECRVLTAVAVKVADSVDTHSTPLLRT